MQQILRQGHAGKGHQLTYYEAMWLWRHGGGKTITVDGRELSSLKIAGHEMALPGIMNLKVHGHVTTNPKNGRIYDGIYDFDIKPNPDNDPITAIRNYLNQRALIEHGKGTPYLIQYRYNDKDFP